MTKFKLAIAKNPERRGCASTERGTSCAYADPLVGFEGGKCMKEMCNKTGLQQIMAEQEEAMGQGKEGDRQPPNMRSPPTFKPWFRLCP